MNLQEEMLKIKNEMIDEFDKRVEALKVEEQEFPQDGDDYWYVDGDAEVMGTVWYGDDSDQGRVSIDNVFKTEEEVEFLVEKLKVEAELRKFSKPFEEREANWMFMWNGYDDNFVTESFSRIIHLGAIYFESEEKARQAIETVGEERIKKYIFGVED